MRTLSNLRWAVKAHLLVVSLAVLSFAACSRVQQQDAPTPAPIPTKLATAVLSLDDTSRTLTLTVDSLAPRRGVAYTFSFRQPVYGALALVGGTLRYTPPASSVAWSVDSAQYTLCQNGSCGRGYIKVRNRMLALCMADADAVWLLSPLGQQDFTLPAGGVFTAHSVENYTLDSLAPGHLQYIAAGNLLNYGYDVIRYSYTIGGNCHYGKVEVIVGDSCQAGARTLLVAAPAGDLIITQAQLLAVAKGCRQQAPVGVFSTQATGTGSATSLRGTLMDTTVSGQPAFTYHRTATSAVPDTANYFFTDDATQRITRGRIIISL